MPRSQTGRGSHFRPADDPGRSGRRLRGLAVALGCGGVLVLAASLTPSADGHGTHTQLGMPTCSWVQMWNFPCPTCGMTTALAQAADGHVLSAALTQPASAVLAILLSVGFWGGLHATATGTRVAASGRWLLRRRVIAGALLLFLGAWVYKMITWNG